MCKDDRLDHVIRAVVINNGFFCHSEIILLSMLTDACPIIRAKGYACILAIRSEKSLNNIPYVSLRLFRNPQPDDFNFRAKHYSEMLNPDKLIHEPPYTQRIEQAFLEDLAKANHQLSVPAFKCHAQDTERLVSVMSSYVGRVSGLENQNAIMQHKIKSRKMIGRITKKNYLMNKTTKKRE